MTAKCDITIPKSKTSMRDPQGLYRAPLIGKQKFQVRICSPANRQCTCFPLRSVLFKEIVSALIVSDHC